MEGLIYHPAHGFRLDTLEEVLTGIEDNLERIGDRYPVEATVPGRRPLPLRTTLYQEERWLDPRHLPLLTEIRGSWSQAVYQDIYTADGDEEDRGRQLVERASQLWDLQAGQGLAEDTGSESSESEDLADSDSEVPYDSQSESEEGDDDPVLVDSDTSDEEAELQWHQPVFGDILQGLLRGPDDLGYLAVLYHPGADRYRFAISRGYSTWVRDINRLRRREPETMLAWQAHTVRDLDEARRAVERMVRDQMLLGRPGLRQSYQLHPDLDPGDIYRYLEVELTRSG